MPSPQRILILFFVAVFLGGTTSTVPISSAPVVLTVTSHPPASLQLPPAAPVDGEGSSGGGPFCTRVHFRGHASRLRDPSRFFHALRGMKLLPTGRKSSLAIFAYSSVVGMTTFFLHYLSGLLRSMLVEIGIAEDMHNPLGIFLLVCIILAGAWFGYWGVRKLVLTEEGSVDDGVAYFVEWAILIISAVMILQSSPDYLLAFAALVFCIIVKTVSRIEGMSGFIHHMLSGLSKGITRPSRYEDLGEGYSNTNGAHQDGFSKLHGEYLKRTPRRNSPLSGSEKKPLSQGLARDSYYSTYHTTPERRKFTKEEYEAFTREETKKGMKQLLSSPDFNRWALANADRISVAPPGSGYNKSSQQRHCIFGLF